jgi:hypothetical protein
VIAPLAMVPLGVYAGRLAVTSVFVKRAANGTQRLRVEERRKPDSGSGQTAVGNVGQPDGQSRNSVDFGSDWSFGCDTNMPIASPAADATVMFEFPLTSVTVVET